MLQSVPHQLRECALGVAFVATLMQHQILCDQETRRETRWFPLVYITEQPVQQLTSSSSSTKPTHTSPFFVSIVAELTPPPFIAYHTSTPSLSVSVTELQSEELQSSNDSFFSSMYRLGTRTACLLRSGLSVHFPFFVETANRPLKSRGKNVLFRPTTS